MLELENNILLNIIINDNSKIMKLKLSDFNYEKTRYIYSIINDMYKNRIDINVVSVANYRGVNKELLNYICKIQDKNQNLVGYNLNVQIQELNKLNRERDLLKIEKYLKENRNKANVINDVKRMLDKVDKIDSNRLVNLATVKADTKKAERYKSYIKGLDRKTNGFQMGQLTIWTGKSGHGKSTFISQMLVEAIEQGYKVCSYSGELKLETFKKWIDLQIAGEENIDLIEDREYGRFKKVIKPEVLTKIENWYNEKIYCYDNRQIQENIENNFVIHVIEEAIRNYGCKVFLIDNLMTCSFENSKIQDFYKAQSDFVGRLSYLTKAYDIHIHLVAHPRKTTGNAITQDDISGTSDTFKRADNVFCIERKENNTNVVKIMKCRETGVNNYEVALNFLEKSKRFYEASNEMSKFRKYSFDGSEDKCPF